MLEVSFKVSYNKLVFRLSENKTHCQVTSEEGTLRRIYTGVVNVSGTGKPCLKWTEIDRNYSGLAGIGDHNYCRNPDREEDREFCFVSPEKKEFCKVRTCGQYER